MPDDQVMSVEEAQALLAKAQAAFDDNAKAIEVAKIEDATSGPPVFKEAKIVGPKKVPISGQSAPSREIPFENLSPRELKLLTTLNGTGTGARKTFAISVLAMECFGGEADSEQQANSWTRNTLRRLFIGGWVDKLARGQYKISVKTRKKIKIV